MPLKQEIMMRVRFIHLIKRMVRPFAIEIVVLTAALLEVGKLVFVAKVFENAPSLAQVGDLALFFSRAFTNTSGMVQLLVLAVAFASVWVIKDIVKTVRMLRQLQYRTA